MTVQVLFVDDEPNVLEGYQRSLRRDFTLATAASGAEGLAWLERNGGVAVVVADRRMPGMDGVEFLARVRQGWPDTTRVMLTGQADLRSTIEAVNAGHIFRFLNKPCPREELADALRAALEHHRLVTAEHDLLRHTLLGSIHALADILSAASPVAFSRTGPLRRLVRYLAVQLGARQTWPFELAAMLAPIGCVTLPADLMLKHYAGEQLTEDEQRMFASHPARGQRMLENIPRLENVARMVGGQQEPYGNFDPEAESETDPVGFGAQLLCLALEYDQLRAWGMLHRAAVDRLRQRAGRYHPRALEALAEWGVFANPQTEAPKDIWLAELQIGMVMAKDLRANDGTCLMVRGQSLTYPLLERLRSYAERIGLREPIAVEAASLIDIRSEELIPQSPKA